MFHTVYHRKAVGTVYSTIWSHTCFTTALLESPPPPQQGANKISSKLHAIYKILSGDIYRARNLQLSPQLFFPRTVFKRAMCIPSPSECACAVVLSVAGAHNQNPANGLRASVVSFLPDFFFVFSHAQCAQTRAAAEMDGHLSVLYVGSVSFFRTHADYAQCIPMHPRGSLPLPPSLLIYSNACIYSRPSSSGKEMHVIQSLCLDGGGVQQPGREREREREETSESNSCPVFSISCSSSSSSSFPFAPSGPPFPSALFYHAHTYTYDSSSSSSSSCPAHNLLFFIREGFFSFGGVWG